MNSTKALLVRWKPTAPWRIGDDSGSREVSAGVLHSDTLYAAVCSAMQSFGWLAEWLDATARAQSPAAVFTSAFPWQGDQIYFPAPLPLWPPKGAGRRVRSATFLPVGVLRNLLQGLPVEEAKWAPDSASGCLLFADRAHRGGPFRHALRTRVSIDRLSNLNGPVNKIGAVEFTENAGLWNAVSFKDEQARTDWRARLVSCFRYLADTGIGGNRSCGWGKSATPSFDDRHIESLIWPEAPTLEGVRAWWSLSLLHPATSDSIDWSRGGYRLLDRAGRIESSEQWGSQKKKVAMISEGSVLVASEKPIGSAPDSAPEGFPHPVYKNGFAVTIEIPWRANA